MGSMLVAFNPRSATADWQKDGIKYENPMQLERMGSKFRDEIVAERRARSRPDPFSVPIVLRAKPSEMRWLNFNPRYPGSVSHATALYEGNWRLATDEEEDKEIARIAGVNITVARQKVDAFDAAAKKLATEPGFVDAVKAIKEADRSAAAVVAEKSNKK